MDIDGDSFEKEQNVIDSVELEDTVTITPSFHSYNGVDHSKRSHTPTSGQVLHSSVQSRTGLGPLGTALMSPKSSAALSHRHYFTPPAGTASPTLLQIQPTISVVIPPSRYTPLPYSTSRSGLVYDVRMRFHEHLTEQHPENPRRISEVFHELVAGGLYSENPSTANENHLLRITIRPATIGELLLVHSAEYVEFVRDLETRERDYIIALTLDRGDNDSIYFHPHSWEAASLAAGGAIEAAKVVVAGQVRNAVAVIRPPGHHAEHDKAGGFCFFNNVCIAAKVVQRDYPDLCRKVLILDWDVHHGNGVQEAFYDDPNVLYISLHVLNMYPYGDYGDYLHCGSGLGLGKNVNIPWESNGMGDADYVYAFQQIVMPVAIEFDPDLVMISAGFDAAEGDSLGGCHISPAGYTHLTHMLMQLARGKVVACLEGGYGDELQGFWNPRPVAKSALAMTRTLMGEPPDRLIDLDLTDSAVRTVNKVIRLQSKFWQCLYPKSLDLVRNEKLGGERLHDIIREWQSKKMWEDYKMTELFILRNKISRTFSNQVLATPNYPNPVPMLIIFHDPPEAMGFPDPKTSQLELHNTWLTDCSKTYVDWAFKNDFSVIDVNVPKHITSEQDKTGYEEPDKVEQRAEMTREMASYLWRNYVETSDSTHVFLLGIGDAYVGLIRLLSEQPNAFNNVTHTFAFVAENAVRRLDCQGSDAMTMANQFHLRSSIFIIAGHPALDPGMKLKKRHGRVIPSPMHTLQEMLAHHRARVTDTLLELTRDWRGTTAPVSPHGQEDGGGAGVGPNGVVNGNVAARARNSGFNGLGADGVGGPARGLFAVGRN